RGGRAGGHSWLWASAETWASAIAGTAPRAKQNCVDAPTDGCLLNRPEQSETERRACGGNGARNGLMHRSKKVVIQSLRLARRARQRDGETERSCGPEGDYHRPLWTAGLAGGRASPLENPARINANYKCQPAPACPSGSF